MTDHHKQLTLSDLDLPRPRGRPKTGNALSSAAKQKLYRDRIKQAGKKTVLLDPLEAGLIESILSHHIVDLDEQDPSREIYVEIRRKVQQLM